MRVLFIGDIFGKPGRRLVQEKLHGLIQEYRIDFCIANVENAAAGFGVTPQIAEEFLNSGDRRAHIRQSYLGQARNRSLPGGAAETAAPSQLSQRELREPAYSSATPIAACALEC